MKIIKPKQNLDDLHSREALERMTLNLSMIDNFLRDHPYVKQNPKVRAKINKALMYLSEAYQMIGDAIDKQD